MIVEESGCRVRVVGGVDYSGGGSGDCSGWWWLVKVNSAG